jgi:predicted TIM-barrel fold metal-dependent hydrolase
MKIDVFNHIFPPALFARLGDYLPKAPVERYAKLTTMHDIEARLRMLDAFDDVQQILSLSQPPLDSFAPPSDTPELARLGNDGMAEWCKQAPDRVPGFIASLPMNNPDAALAEIDRACLELNACGVQIYSNVEGKPLDSSEFWPVFERMAQLGKPIWLHPARPPRHADYLTEDRSMFDIWWGLGWAYETSAAMARIVFNLTFEKLPDIQIITHHWGANIPQAEGKMPSWGRLGSRTGEDFAELLGAMKKPLNDYFKMFYADTAMFGGGPASQCGLDYFGAGHSLFATDCPYDTEGGAILIRDTIDVVSNLRCSDADKQAISEGNAKRMLGL